MEFKAYVANSKFSILETMDFISKGAKGLAYVCNDDGELLGVVTDGDIRRYIVKNGDLKAFVSSLLNNKPIIKLQTDTTSPIELMKKNNVTSIPIVDNDNKLRSIEFLNSGRIYQDVKLNIPVVMMAGGKGTRLFPYTKVLPKPLIPVGEKTITEHIFDHFNVFGCNNFKVVVNYKKELIKAYFKEINSNYEIDFIDEPEFWGTGGGLKLLQGEINGTFFMTNCDVLIKDDYAAMLKLHKKNKNMVTIVCAVKKVEIPYGTIKMDNDGHIVEMLEKPTYSFITNTGFYIIEPEFLNKIPKDTFIHITDVIQNCIDAGENIGVYPVSNEAWLDMGQMDELEKMRENLK